MLFKYYFILQIFYNRTKFSTISFNTKLIFFWCQAYYLIVHCLSYGNKGFSIDNKEAIKVLWLRVIRKKLSDTCNFKWLQFFIWSTWNSLFLCVTRKWKYSFKSKSSQQQRWCQQPFERSILNQTVYFINAEQLNENFNV